MNKTGFGFLRLPRIDAQDEKSIDYAELNRMVDTFLAQGGTYFDTAYTYLGGVSEEALRKSLVERYPRESFRIADKLPGWKVKEGEDCRRYFDEQLARCGVDYFDVYLIHWLNAANYAIAQSQDQFGFLRKLKDEGKARAIGFSYHDGPELLERILTEHPECDYVQLQLNYLDWDSVSIQAHACYDVAVQHGKKVIVMEPVKGGSLAALPEEAAALLAQHAPQESAASWAIRFASSLEGVETVLSGMSTSAQVEDNMRAFAPLTDAERAILAKAAGIIRANTAIACTGCGYCVPNCPMNIPIPQYFALCNDHARSPSEGWKMQHAYRTLAAQYAQASVCIGCGRCRRNCPQKLDIPTHLQQVVKAFEQ